MKKVLILYAEAGHGHMASAKAISEALQEKDPVVIVKLVNVLDFADPVYRKVFVDGYHYISEKRPSFWKMLYKSFNRKAAHKLPTLISRISVEKKFINFIKDFSPDFIVSTHPLPMLLVSDSKEKNLIDITSSLVVTDFGCHSFWVNEEVNFYFVATDEVGKCLAGFGVSQDKVIATGIPIALKFSQKFNKQDVLRKLNLNPTKKTILIAGGQFNYADIKQVVYGLKEKNSQQVQFIIVAGRHQELAKALNKDSLKNDPDVRAFGFIDNMEELMAASDLIFSKAGGLTVSESMAMQLPLVIHKIIPGQEEDNARYLVEQEAAIKVSGVKNIIKEVSELLADEKKLAEMKKAAAYVGRPNAAREVASFILKQLSS